MLWSVGDGPATTALPKAKYSRDQVPPSEHWGKHDLFADPNFVSFDADRHKPVDLRPQHESPAVARK